MLREGRRLWCVLFHWDRKRDSFGNRCTRCNEYW